MNRRQKKEKGFVLITMAIMAIAIVAAVGLAVDLGHMFIVKNETQSFCDSAALAAATKLDGTSTGITNAKNAVTNTSMKWNFNNASISSPTVQFAAASTGPWSTNPTSPTGIAFVQVTASVSANVYFIPIVTGSFTQAMASTAVAGQVAITTLNKGLAPYTAIVQDGTGKSTNWGFTQGGEYSIQMAHFSGSSSNCGTGNGNASNCFNGNICANDSNYAMSSVVSAWGSSFNGYWGSSNNNDIYQEVINDVQTVPISVNENIASILTAGNKNAQAAALDQRTQQDLDTSDKTVTGYLANTGRNGRRLIAVPVVQPVNSTTTTVVGFAAFMLESKGNANTNYYTSGNGNDAFCAMYVGPYVQGSSSGGGSTSAGLYKVELVQ